MKVTLFVGLCVIYVLLNSLSSLGETVKNQEHQILSLKEENADLMQENADLAESVLTESLLHEIFRDELPENIIFIEGRFCVADEDRKSFSCPQSNVESFFSCEFSWYPEVRIPDKYAVQVWWVTIMEDDQLVNVRILVLIDPDSHLSIFGYHVDEFYC